MTTSKKVLLFCTVFSLFSTASWSALGEEETDESSSKINLTVSSYSWQDFERLWEDRRLLKEKNDLEAADKLLDKALAMKELADWPDLFTLSRALRSEALQAEQAGQLDLAEKYLDKAILLAPDDAENHFALAAFNLKHHLFNPPTYLEELASLLALRFSDWRTAIHFKGNMLFISLGFVLLFSLFFLILAYIHRLRLMIHELSHLFPQGAPEFLIAIIFLLLLLLPPLFHLGIFWYVLVYGVLIWIVMSSYERFIYTIILAILFLYTLLLPRLTAPLGAPASNNYDLYMAAMDPMANPHTNKLLARELASRKDGQNPATIFSHEELFVLGFKALKSGNLADLSVKASYEQARRYLQIAAEKPELSSDAYVGVAIAAKFLDDFEGAKRGLEAAMQIKADNITAYFDLARLYFANMQANEAALFLQKAHAIDSLEAVKLNDRAMKYGQLYMAYPVFKSSFFATLSEEEQFNNKEYLTSEIWHHLSRWPRAHYMIASAILWLLLFAFSSFVRREPATSCKRCGRPACRRCHPRMVHQDLCYTCYQEEAYRQNGLKNEEVKPKGLFTISYFKRQKLVRHLLKILAFVFPPATLFFTGRKRSIVYLILYTVALLNGALGLSLITVPFLIPAGGRLFLIITGAFILLITLVVGIRGSYLEVRK